MKPKNVFWGIIAAILGIQLLDTQAGQAAAGTVGRGWNAGSRWLQWGIVIITTWPLLMVAVAFTPYPDSKSWAALLPLVGIVIILLTIFDPMVLGVIGGFKVGRRILVRLAGIVAFELLVGAYFASVPTYNDQGLIPLALLLLVSIPFISVGIAGKARRALLTLVVLGLVVLATIYYLGGREQAGRRVENWLRQFPPATAAPTARPTIDWGQPTMLHAPADDWSEEYRVGGRPFKVVPALGYAAEMINDRGRYQYLNPYQQVDVGDGINWVKVRGVGGRGTIVYLYFAK